MKLPPGGDSDILGMPVDSLLMNSWNSIDFSSSDVRHFLIGEDTKLVLGDTDDDSNDHKPTTIDDLDLLLTATNTQTTHHHHQQPNNTLAELKPLPPFTGYTGHLSINGISGHHYHTIAAAPNSPRILIETNNNSVETTNQNNVPYYPTDHVVSSSTMDNTIDNIKTESIIEYNLSTEMDEDFAAIISSAMADTTVPGNAGTVDGNDSGDSWLDLETWIGSACGQNASPPTSSTKNNVSMCPETMQDFVGNSQFATSPPPPPPSIPFHHHHSQQQQQHLKPAHPPPQSHHQRVDLNAVGFPHMSLLQSRLQNGPTKVEPPPSSIDMSSYNMVPECTSPSSSTQYLARSPSCHVVSTSDIGYIQVHSSTIPSPDELQVSFPHTTTPSKKSRSRSKAKSMAASSIVYSEGNLGKEKTVHRCNICNRGFLNKSNIKVHLRTHTGEKPFRCEVCGKAFRQKAHLIKHAQIHKRIGRD